MVVLPAPLPPSTTLTWAREKPQDRPSKTRRSPRRRWTPSKRTRNSSAGPWSMAPCPPALAIGPPAQHSKGLRERAKPARADAQPHHPIRPPPAVRGRPHLAPGGGGGARSRARARAAALRPAGRLRLQPARLRAPRARELRRALRRHAQARPLPRHESGPFRDDSDRGALRRGGLRPRLARHPGADRLPSALPPQAPGDGLRMPPERGERSAGLGRDLRALAPTRALLRQPLHRQLLPAALPGGERAQPDARPPAAPRAGAALRGLRPPPAPGSGCARPGMGGGDRRLRRRPRARRARRIRPAARVHHPPEPGQSSRQPGLGRPGGARTGRAGAVPVSNPIASLRVRRARMARRGGKMEPRRAAAAIALAITGLAGPAGGAGNAWFEAGHQAAREARAEPADSGRARNVILFLGDGMGITTVTAARILEGQRRGESGEDNVLAFERFPYTAFSKVYATDSQTPESAGTMTAIMTGA